MEVDVGCMLEGNMEAVGGGDVDTESPVVV